MRDFCTNCGSLIENGWSFCANCRKDLTNQSQTNIHLKPVPRPISREKSKKAPLIIVLMVFAIIIFIIPGLWVFLKLSIALIVGMIVLGLLMGKIPEENREHLEKLKLKASKREFPNYKGRGMGKKTPDRRGISKRVLEGDPYVDYHADRWWKKVMQGKRVTFFPEKRGRKKKGYKKSWLSRFFKP